LAIDATDSDTAREAVVVVDHDAVREISRSVRETRVVPRIATEALRFVVALDSTFVAVADDGTDLVVTALDESHRTIRVARAFPIETMRRATHGATLYFASASSTGAVSMDEFSLGSSRIEHRRRTLDRGADGLGREIVGLAASDAGFALLFRRGVPEDDRGGVVLATRRGTREVPALHDLGLLESIECGEQGVTVVGSFEFDRPIEFRFDLRGRLLAHDRLAPRASIASSRRFRANVEVDGASIVVRIRDGAGDLLSETRFRRSAGARSPMIARESHGFAVAWTDRTEEGWGIRIAHLTDPSTP